MRVISGKYRGRKLKGFDLEGTRPTMDRVKESLFAMLQTDLKDSICLDLFAGSGALGIEAISNGATYCYFVDKSHDAIKTVKENLEQLGMKDRYKILQQDGMDALACLAKEGIQFDLVFLDPPYQLQMIKPVLRYLEQHAMLKLGGKIICEYETEVFTSSVFRCIREKSYGTKKIKVYQYVGKEE